MGFNYEIVTCIADILCVFNILKVRLYKTENTNTSCPVRFSVLFVHFITKKKEIRAWILIESKAAEKVTFQLKSCLFGAEKVA